MEQRTVNTILVALRYWQRDLPSGDVPDSVLEIARDGERTELSVGEIDDLCGEINEHGLKLMTDETGHLEHAILCLLDRGFKISLNKPKSHEGQIEVEIYEADPDTFMRVYIPVRKRLSSVVALLNRAIGMSRAMVVPLTRD
jgi:hypothetical protein